jgi:hypothetical protein
LNGVSHPASWPFLLFEEILMKNQILFVALITLVLSVFASALADGPTEGRAGRAELRYMEGMIDHHQMAVDMANDCLVKVSSEELKTICQNVIDAQTAEIAQLQDWLLSWYNVQYAPVAMMAEDDGMEHGGMDHGGMDGMPHTDPAMMMGMMAGLNRVEGIDYDIAWAKMAAMPTCARWPKRSSRTNPPRSRCSKA